MSPGVKALPVYSGLMHGTKSYVPSPLLTGAICRQMKTTLQILPFLYLRIVKVRKYYLFNDKGFFFLDLHHSDYNVVCQYE